MATTRTAARRWMSWQRAGSAARSGFGEVAAGDGLEQADQVGPGIEPEQPAFPVEQVEPKLDPALQAVDRGAQADTLHPKFSGGGRPDADARIREPLDITAQIVDAGRQIAVAQADPAEHRIGERQECGAAQRSAHQTGQQTAQERLVLPHESDPEPMFMICSK